MRHRLRFVVPLALATLFLAACSQMGQTPSTILKPTAAAQIPLPDYSKTHTGDTRGFWFQAPVDFRITGLRVPDESGRGLQNVEVFKLTGAPPEYSNGSASGGQVFYKTGVASGEIIETDISFTQGDYVGILGAAGDASSMSNSYGPDGTFNSSILGEPVVLTRFLTQSNIVTSGGNQPYSGEASSAIARVEVYVEEAASEPDRYTIGFEKSPANRVLYNVKTGQGIVYHGEGSAQNSTVPVVGKRRLNGKILVANTAKVMSLYGSKRLTVSSGTVNAPATQGGRIKLTFTNFDPQGVTLTSLTLNNLTAKGAYLTFYYATGGSSRQNLSTTAAGANLVVPLEVKNLRAVDIYAPTAYSVDDVEFDIFSQVEIDPCESATSRC